MTAARTVVGLLCILATSALQTADATTLLAFRTPDRVIIGADSASQSLRAGTQSEDCKLFLGPAVAIAAGGLTRVDTRDGSAAYDLDQVAKEVALAASSLSDALRRLRQATIPVAEGVPVAVKNTVPLQYPRLLLRTANGREYGRFAGYLVAGVEKGQPSMAKLLFDFSLPVGPVDMRKVAEVDVTQEVCPPACPSVGEPFVLGLDAGVRMALPQSKADHSADPIRAVRLLLSAQSLLTPKDVRAPFAIAEVTRQRIRWVSSAGCID